MRLVVAHSPTVRFDVPIMARRCMAGRGMLMHGASDGQGVLVWLRGAAGQVLDTGTYPLLPRGDSASSRGAIASVRFLVGDVAHGLTLDDGSATVTVASPPFALRVRGVGLETALAEQRSAELTLEQVPLASDTVPCGVQP